MSKLDDAISDALDGQGRYVTEWVVFACTQSLDDQDAEAGYQAIIRPGMLPHHVTGLIDTATELLHGETREED